MTNEYGSAFKTVTDREVIEQLFRAGWHEVKQEAEEKPVENTVESVEAPKIMEITENDLMYKGKYLSQWLAIASKEQLRSILAAKGVVVPVNTLKSEMQQRLRAYIRETKKKRGA